MVGPKSTVKKPQFKRNYVACLNCRTRKVKCDLGSVDNPHDPPCARCKRERKECVFVDSKRGSTKQKTRTTQTVSHPNSINPILPLPNPYFHANSSMLNENHAMKNINIPMTNNPNPLLLKETLSSDFYQMSGSLPPSQKHPTHRPSRSQSFESDPKLDQGNQDSSGNSSEKTIKKINLSELHSNSSVPLGVQNFTNNATMIYLAHVSGNVASQTTYRDHASEAERLSELEKSVPIPRSVSSSNVNDSPSNSYFDSKIMSSAKDSEPIQDTFGHDKSGVNLNPIMNNDRFTIPPLTTTHSMIQRPTTQLDEIDYIISSNEPDAVKENYILTDVEAKRLIRLFFITLHPFYPYVPKEMRNHNVLANYPILLCAILAISSRYNSLPEKIGDWDKTLDDDTESRKAIRGEKNIYMNNVVGERHLAVHEKLWIYCQRLMSMTVWGESSSRSVGTILTFLLFTEWNPRAIHFRWGDYANSSHDDSLANRKTNKNKNVGKDPTHLKSKRKSSQSAQQQQQLPQTTQLQQHRLENQQTENESEEEFAGLSAMKRSEIMSFMLIGTATRLSFLLETDPLIFIATHISEINIAVGLNKKSMLQQTLSEVDVNEVEYGFTSYQKANIELLQFFSLCYETLYGTRPKFITLDKYQTLAILDILSPILENWYRKYHKLLKPSNVHCAPLASCGDEGSPDWLYLISVNPKLEKDLTIGIERESLILDYYYTKLYLYSLALSGDTSVNSNLRNSKKGRNLRLDELSRYSRYVELAYKAAKEVLAVIQRVKKLKLLKYMPVRWVTRVIKSVSFIVKCYLTLTTEVQTNKNSGDVSRDRSESSSSAFEGHSVEENTNGEILKLSVIPLEEIITLLQKTAICLRYAAPDELHLCTRYSTILMYLCSQFKTQIRERNDKLRNGIREYEKDPEFQDTDEQPDLPTKVDSFPVGQYQHPPQNSATYTGNENMAPSWYNNQGIYQNMSTVPSEYDQKETKPPGTNQGYQNLEGTLPNINFSNANQELFDDFFNKNPSEKLFNFFSTNDNNPGLDFVDQFTSEIEKDFLSKGGKH
ncbi:Transcriptional activator ARO80 [Pichia kudriavzevii]|uniref:Transcriptional activator ARO80 n=2 Tax=Pichia kudriavzevii TaxID=4909 RepID=A0A1V2LRU1_PICKU|nr:Transcriptional activator ARO80 [Pichia kudriavzevii]